MNIKLNPSMIVSSVLAMVLGFFLLQMITKKKVNGVTIQESFLGFTGHSGALANLFGDDE